jgi:MSHA biogenesis protein MshJ
MKMPPAIEKLTTRFDALSLRERALIAAALLAALVMLWDTALMKPLQNKQQSLTGDLTTLQQNMAALAGTLETGNTDPTTVALEQERGLQQSLDATNAELASASAGLIAPDRMVQVIEDVLNHQKGVRLIELRNKPVSALTEPATDPQQAAPVIDRGPYVHPIEITIEGSYIDVLSYLRELEALPWRMYWKVLELKTREYPVNRVRIEINTLSMDKAWLGV